jgi:hypothetical protein
MPTRVASPYASGPRPRALLRAQGLDGIEPGGSTGGHDTGGEAGEETHHEASEPGRVEVTAVRPTNGPGTGPDPSRFYWDVLQL